MTQTVTPTWTTADRIRKAREVAGLEQQQLAAVTGLSRATLYNYEHGKTKPSRANVKLIGLETGVDHHWILTGTPGDLESSSTKWYVGSGLAA